VLAGLDDRHRAALQAEQRQAVPRPGGGDVADRAVALLHGRQALRDFLEADQARLLPDHRLLHAEADISGRAGTARDVHLLALLTTCEGGTAGAHGRSLAAGGHQLLAGLGLDDLHDLLVGDLFGLLRLFLGVVLVRAFITRTLCDQARDLGVALGVRLL